MDSSRRNFLYVTGAAALGLIVIPKISYAGIVEDFLKGAGILPKNGSKELPTITECFAKAIKLDIFKDKTIEDAMNKNKVIPGVEIPSTNGKSVWYVGRRSGREVIAYELEPKKPLDAFIDTDGDGVFNLNCLLDNNVWTTEKKEDMKNQGLAEHFQNMYVTRVAAAIEYLSRSAGNRDLKF